MAAKTAFEHAYAVILAGGSGTRFWPLSRRRRPKQLLRLHGPKTLLEQTLDRIARIIPPSRTFVFTGAPILREVRRALPRVPPSQIIAEPAARNTAPALGVGAPPEPGALPTAHGVRAARHRAGGRRARGPNVSAPVAAPGKGLHRLRANGEDFRRLCRSRRPRVERRGKLGGRVRASEKGRARERPAAGEPPVRRAREHGVFAGQVRFGAGVGKLGGDGDRGGFAGFPVGVCASG